MARSTFGSIGLMRSEADFGEASLANHKIHVCAEDSQCDKQGVCATLKKRHQIGRSPVNDSPDNLKVHTDEIVPSTTAFSFAMHKIGPDAHVLKEKKY